MIAKSRDTKVPGFFCPYRIGFFRDSVCFDTFTDAEWRRCAFRLAGNQQTMSQIFSFRTREVRWFVNKPVLEVPGWFEKLPSTAFTRESREDIYLVLPDRTDLGVKFREDRLELKYRLGDPQSGVIAPGISGYFETWEKLGFQSTREVSSAELPDIGKALRLPVKKCRWATKIEQTDTGVKYHPVGTKVKHSVQLEYTELQVFGSDWYSIGLEWPDMPEISLPVRLLSGILTSTVFDLKSSMGYPEFLQKMLRQEGSA